MVSIFRLGSEDKGWLSIDIEFGLDKGTFQGWGLFRDWDLSVVSLTIQSWSLILQYHNQFGVRIFFFDLQTFFPD